MKTPTPPSRSLRELRELTPARVGLGRAGASMPTEALLAFTLDHARRADDTESADDLAVDLVGRYDHDYNCRIVRRAQSRMSPRSDGAKVAPSTPSTSDMNRPSAIP